MGKADRYILFKGHTQPLSPMKATDSKLKEISSIGYKQGKDYDIVPLKIILDLRGEKKGGKIKTYAKGSIVRKPRSY
jgi:hypothetical protein